MGIEEHLVLDRGEWMKKDFEDDLVVNIIFWD